MSLESNPVSRNSSVFHFGEFCADASERRLTRNGENVAIAPRSFDALLLLLQNTGRLVERATLREKLWDGAIVEETALARVIADTRKALGDMGGERRYIETVTKFGYRFIASVERINAATAGISEPIAEPSMTATLPPAVDVPHGNGRPSGTQLDPYLTPAVVSAQLESILKSSHFSGAPTLSRLLQHVVTRTLEGRADELKEYSLGVEVLERKESYDPRIDPIVRMQVRDIRARLMKYYEESANGNTLRISIPKGGYRAEFAASGAREIAAESASRSRLRMLLALAVIVVFVAVSLAIWVPRVRELQIGPVVRLTPDSVVSMDPGLSSDGGRIVYASDRDSKTFSIWLQQRGSPDPVRLTNHADNDAEPAISPDGGTIVFRCEGDRTLHRIGADGSGERIFAANGRQPRFSPDGRWIVYWTGPPRGGAVGTPGSGQMYVADAATGQTRRLAPEFDSAQSPTWLPDSKHVFFFGRDGRQIAVDGWICPLDGGPAVATGVNSVLQRAGLNPFGNGDDLTVPAATSRYLLLPIQGGPDTSSIWAAPFSERTWKVEQAPRRLTSGASFESAIAVTESGAVAIASRQIRFRIWQLPIDPASGKAAGEARAATPELFDAVYPSLSRDGAKLLFGRAREGRGQLALFNYGDQSLIQLETPKGSGWPMLSADGGKILYKVFEGDGRLEYLDVDVRRPVALCTGCGTGPYAWSDAGHHIAYTTDAPDKSRRTEIWLLDTVSGTRSVLLRDSEYTLWAPAFDPAGKWMAFHARSGAIFQVFIAPFDAGQPVSRARWIRVSTPEHNDMSPRFSANGRRLYFLSNRDGHVCLWAQNLDGARHPVGDLFAVHHLHEATNNIENLPLSFAHYGVGQDKIVFSTGVLVSQIWASRLQGAF